MEEKKPRIGIVDVVNIAGSIASITGISLLWLKGSIPVGKLVTTVPVVAAAAAMSLTLISLAFVSVRYGYREFAASRDRAVKFMYFSFAVAIALVMLWIAGHFMYDFVYLIIRDASL